MTTEETVKEPVKEEEAVKQPDEAALQEAREAERRRYTREESLRRELEDAKKKLKDLRTQSEPKAAEQKDVKSEIEELRNEIEKERSKRQEIEELGSIVDFLHKNSAEYELTKQLPDGPKYVRYVMQKHYEDTGKLLAYADAALKVEDELVKMESERFSLFSKTKKAQKIYGLRTNEPQQVEQGASAKKVESTEPAKAKQQESDIPNLYKSNSREAFHYFKKKHGFA